MITKTLVATLATAVLLVAAPADAEVRELKLRLSHVLAPDFSKYNGTEKFVEGVTKKSGGKIDIRVFTNGVLGGDAQMVSAMQGGILDIGMMGPQVLNGIDRDFALFDLPYLYDNEEEAKAILAGPIGLRLYKKLESKGLMVFPVGGLGFRHIHNSKHPITKLEDIKGLKIRVFQSPAYIDLLNTLGANAVPMPFPELYTAMETKTVDGATGPIITTITNKFYEVQKYFSLTGHMYSPQVMIMAKKTWDKLNDDEKKIIVEAQQEAMDFSDKGKAFEAEFSKLMDVNAIAPAEMERIKAAAQPVIDKYAERMTPGLVKEVQETVAKLRASKK